MEKLLTVLFFIVVIVEYASFYYIVLRKKIKVSKKRGIGLLCISIILALDVLKEWKLDDEILTMMMFFILLSLFDVKIGENIKFCLFALVVLGVWETVVHAILNAVITLGELEVTIVYITIIIVGLWIYYLLLGRKLNLKALQLPTKVWGIIVCIMLILEVMISYFSFVLTKIPLGKKTILGIILISCGGMAICILLFAMIYYFNVTQKYYTQVEVLEEYNEQQKEYFEQLLKREQDTRQFRHDIINELLEMKTFCDGADYERLHDYLREMLGAISEISNRQYDVGNDIVNTILNYYLQPIQNECSITVGGYMDDNLEISQRDTCIVVSNLIKNAVEAVDNIKDGHPQIYVSVSQGTKYLNICVKNTFENEEISKFKLGETSKKDKKNHGLGLRNVQTIVQKYDGIYKRKIEEGYYIAEVILKNNRSQG